MKILLADDSRTMRNIQRQVLQTISGVQIAECGDGQEALATIAATPGGFDLAIIDSNMPNLDGLGLIRSIRKTDQRTVLIMASTDAETGSLVAAFQAGMNDYIIKPFTPQQLIEVVDGAMKKRRQAA